MEIWKTIESVGNGFYLVSNLSRMRSLKCKSDIVMKQPINSAGYPVVNIVTDGRRYPVLVHRLVAEAFIPNPENKLCVNHKNGDKTDNRIDNLEWCTYSENTLHAFRVLGRKGSATGKFGKENHTSKAVIQKTREGLFVKDWDCILDVRRTLNIQPGNISAVCRNKRKMAGGFAWEFKKNYNN